ncbi:kinase-like domain-containing protein [Rhizophagus irregularis DAOM 181602=DAOM 197198]|nr:kinase-like domain-containing protein [Rhizophagus irregularis DAOM 181602=DAOM 197198]
MDEIKLNEELKECYKENGLCRNCKQLNTGRCYCQPCKSQYFKQNFKNWTSGNHDVDEFIQKAQLKASDSYKVIEWIEYDKFEDVEYLAKGGFGTTFKAVWKDGPFRDYNIQGERKGETKVALKCLHNSQDITAEFLKEVESNILALDDDDWIVRCFDPLKRPNAEEVRESTLKLYKNSYDNEVNSVIYGQVKEADEKNKESSLTIQSPLSSTKPKNSDNNDLLGVEYSDSLKMDFTKLDINPKDERN